MQESLSQSLSLYCFFYFFNSLAFVNSKCIKLVNRPFEIIRRPNDVKSKVDLLFGLKPLIFFRVTPLIVWNFPAYFEDLRPVNKICVPSKTETYRSEFLVGVAVALHTPAQTPVRSWAAGCAPGTPWCRSCTPPAPAVGSSHPATVIPLCAFIFCCVVFLLLFFLLIAFNNNITNLKTRCT